MRNIKLDKIEDAISDIKNGNIIIVVDDENRENEGDFITAAETIDSSKINFMAKNGRGLICVPMSEKLCSKLSLGKMVPNNTDPLETAFTVSVDLKGNGVTSGISASDRAKTVQALVDNNTKPEDLQRPGHVFPLIAKNGGVLRRTGHTEAAIDFARLAGFEPAGCIVEIMNEDGTMARLPQLVEVAKNFDLKIVSIEDLVAYRMEHDSLIEKKEDFEIETKFGQFRLRAYLQTTNQRVHLALTKGNWNDDDAVPVRINASLVNNDLLATLTQDAHIQLEAMFAVLNEQKKGAMVFINQDSSATNLLRRLTELKSNQKPNTVTKAPQVRMDVKDFGIGAQILHDLKIHKIQLISNHQQSKRVGMIGYGLEITEYISY